MTRYGRGATLERRLKKKLEKEGFWVIRAAGSKGVADLVAIKNSQPYLIQVKSGRCGRIDMIRLQEVAEKCGAFAFIAIWKKTPKKHWVFIRLGGGDNNAKEGSIL